MKTLEWPKGSGRTAEYDDDELASIREMIATGKERGIPSAQVSAEITLIHDLKVDLGARMVPIPDDLDLGFDLAPDQVSLLPASLVRERQLELVIAARKAA